MGVAIAPISTRPQVKVISSTGCTCFSIDGWVEGQYDERTRKIRVVRTIRYKVLFPIIYIYIYIYIYLIQFDDRVLKTSRNLKYSQFNIIILGFIPHKLQFYERLLSVVLRIL